MNIWKAVQYDQKVQEHADHVEKIGKMFDDLVTFEEGEQVQLLTKPILRQLAEQNYHLVAILNVLWTIKAYSFIAGFAVTAWVIRDFMS